jgi:hypothetical protein
MRVEAENSTLAHYEILEKRHGRRLSGSGRAAVSFGGSEIWSCSASKKSTMASRCGVVLTGD